MLGAQHWRRSLASRLKSRVVVVAPQVSLAVPIRMQHTQPPTNALVNERSPYLRQHAHNPVNWLPWSPASLELARSQNKPILLSSGYSTCHWCHVMAAGAFSDPAVAAVLNDAFVPIKADREERPDVDGVYMSYLTMTEGHGGWPLTVFLTPPPHLSPIFAGTYFPKETFLQVCKKVAEVWADKARRPHLIEQTNRIMAAVAAAQAPKSGGAGTSPIAEEEKEEMEEEGSPGVPAERKMTAAKEEGKEEEEVEKKGEEPRLASTLSASIKSAIASLLGEESTPASSEAAPQAEWLSKLASDASYSTFTALTRRFDPLFGGFGMAPKFPRPTELQFLMSYAVLLGAARPRPSATSAAQTVASVPFMITRAMKVQLLEAGFSGDEIKNMTPSQAHQHLTKAKAASEAADVSAAQASAGTPEGQPQQQVSISSSTAVPAAPPVGWPVNVRAVQQRIVATGLSVNDSLAGSKVATNGLDKPELALLQAWYSLRRMTAGGLFDHLGGGYHRYSTDREWRVPHFEKMLYDQAAILKALSDAYVITGDPLLANAGLATVQYLMRDMQHSDGGFYSAEDADSAVPPSREGKVPTARWLPPHHAPSSSASGAAGITGAAQSQHRNSKEGAFYLWTKEEVTSVLRAAETELSAATAIPADDVTDLFCSHYMLTGTSEEGNTNSSPASDPHGELYGLCVLAETGTVAHTRTVTSLHSSIYAEDDVTAALAAARRILLEHRSAFRERPGRDGKILTSWNGQIISALARAAVTLAQPRVPRDMLASAGGGESSGSGSTPRQGLLASVGGDALHFQPAPASAAASSSSSSSSAPAAGTTYHTCISAAEGAVAFIRHNLTSDGQGAQYPIKLLRSFCGGPSSINAFLDDYSSLIDGLVELYQATGEEGYLRWAEALQAEQDAAFLDPGGTGVYLNTRGDDPSIKFRSVPDQDGAEPCANALAAYNLVRLAAITDKPLYSGRTQGLFTYFEAMMRSTGIVMPLMSVALQMAQAAEQEELLKVEILWPQGMQPGTSEEVLAAALFASSREPGPKVIVHKSNALPPSAARPRVQACRKQSCSILTE